MVSFYNISLSFGDIKIRKNFVSYLNNQRFIQCDSKTICLSQDFSDSFYLPQSIREILETTFCVYQEFLPGTSVNVDVYRKKWNKTVVTWRGDNRDLDEEFNDVAIAVDTSMDMEVVGILSEGGNFLANQVNPLMFRTTLADLELQFEEEKDFEI